MLFGFIVRRLLLLPPLAFVAATLLWWLMRLMTGGPSSRFAGARGVTSAQIDQWLIDHCLSHESRRAPDLVGVLREYGGWLGIWNCDRQSLLTRDGSLNALPTALGGGTNGVIHGDLGYSLDTGHRVVDDILHRLPITLMLTIPPLLIAIALTILVGVYGARRRSTGRDRAIDTIGYIFASMPVFWLGQMLFLVFAWRLRLAPPGGLYTYGLLPSYGTPEYWHAFWSDPFTGFLDLSKHLVLPWATLVLVTVGADSRYIRESVGEALQQTYVRAARARGLPERTVVYKHALRNALLPYVSRVGLQVPIVFAGSVGIEVVFGIRGMGNLFLEALRTRDYFVLIDVLVVLTVVVIVINLITDVIYAIIDPRIRFR